VTAFREERPAANDPKQSIGVMGIFGRTLEILIGIKIHHRGRATFV